MYACIVLCLSCGVMIYYIMLQVIVIYYIVSSGIGLHATAFSVMVHALCMIDHISRTMYYEYCVLCYLLYSLSYAWHSLDHILCCVLHLITACAPYHTTCMRHVLRYLVYQFVCCIHYTSCKQSRIMRSGPYISRHAQYTVHVIIYLRGVRYTLSTL